MSAVRPNFGGPVSAALEADVRGWIRKQGIVVWLDPHGHYTEFVDRLAVLGAGGALPYAVYAFRGSHLALMRALEGVAAELNKANCDHQILLSWASPEETKALAARFPQFDIVATAGGGDEPPAQLATKVMASACLWLPLIAINCH